MIGVINLFLPLAVQLMILYFLARLLDRIVLKQLGRNFYLALTWPGVVIHELSHLIGCIITFTRVRRVHLFYPHGDTLGMVEHDRVHNPIYKIIISIAPLFGVTGVIWLLTKWVFPELYLSQIESIGVAFTDFTSFQRFFSFTGEYFSTYWAYIANLFSSVDFTQWQTYLFIYLMLTISSHAAPSKVDLKHTYLGIFGLAVLLVLVHFVDQWMQVPITWTIAQWLSQPIFIIANFLSYGIIFTGATLIVMSLVSLSVRLLKRGV